MEDRKERYLYTWSLSYEKGCLTPGYASWCSRGMGQIIKGIKFCFRAFGLIFDIYKF